MANLYITEQGCVLRKTGERLIVEKQGDDLLDVPCDKVEHVLIFGNVQFTTQAVHELFEHGIGMALLTRSGRLIGHLVSPATKNIDLRLAQFRKYEDLSFRLAVSKTIVEGKIANCLSLMRSFSYNHPDIPLSAETAAMQESAAAVGGAGSIDSLMGMEGTAARTYFAGFAKMVLGDFAFEGRRKHPPTDPINALLSFGYTLVFNEIASLAGGLGFDPYLGYFHSTEYGRASLASDLLEEFRASVDRLTLYAVNDRIFRPEDFYPNPRGEGIYLTREALKRYFAHYEKYVEREFVHAETKESTTLRKCLRSQAEKLAVALKGEKAYTTFQVEV